MRAKRVGLVGWLAAWLALAMQAAASSKPGQSTAALDAVPSFKLEALMPEHAANHAEAYLCTSVQLPDKALKLIGVEPLSKQEVVHHMLLYGGAPKSSAPRFLRYRL